MLIGARAYHGLVSVCVIMQAVGAVYLTVFLPGTVSVQALHTQWVCQPGQCGARTLCAQCEVQIFWWPTTV